MLRKTEHYILYLRWQFILKISPNPSQNNCNITVRSKYRWPDRLTIFTVFQRNWRIAVFVYWSLENEKKKWGFLEIKIHILKLKKWNITFIKQCPNQPEWNKIEMRMFGILRFAFLLLGYFAEHSMSCMVFKIRLGWMNLRSSVKDGRYFFNDVFKVFKKSLHIMLKP